MLKLLSPYATPLFWKGPWWKQDYYNRMRTWPKRHQELAEGCYTFLPIDVYRCIAHMATFVLNNLTMYQVIESKYCVQYVKSSARTISFLCLTKSSLLKEVFATDTVKEKILLVQSFNQYMYYLLFAKSIWTLFFKSTEIENKCKYSSLTDTFVTTKVIHVPVVLTSHL